MKSRGMKSWRSNASRGSTKGRGMVQGAGELMHPGMGPGSAAKPKMGLAAKEFAVAAAPPGTASGPMDIYSEGGNLGRGYKYPRTR